MRKSFAAALVTAMVLPLTVFAEGLLASGLQVIIQGHVVTFVDVAADAWFSAYVRAAAEAGIVSGYKDAEGNLTGNFGPSDSVTVAQALKIAVEGAGYDEGAYATVESGAGDHWAAAYVSVAKAEQFELFLLNIDLDRPASRAEVMSLLVDAFKVEKDAEVGDRFTDVTSSTRFASSIEALSHENVVSGDADAEGKLTGRFRPSDPINRAESVKVVTKAREVYGTRSRGRKSLQGEVEETNVIRYTNDGFVPASLTVSTGTRVEFRNESTREMWVASDPHPVHTALAELDAKRLFLPGDSFYFQFTQAGSWGFHNHVRPTDIGNVVVEE